MKFQFDAHHVARAGSKTARMREATRFLILTEAMRRLGQDVKIREIPGIVRGTVREAFFTHLVGQHDNRDVVVVPAEREKVHGCPTVGIKSAKSTDSDRRYLDMYTVLLAHEHDPSIPVGTTGLAIGTWLVHDKVIGELINAGLFDAYIDDDVASIRDHYCTRRRRPEAVFVGSSINGRKHHFYQLRDAAKLIGINVDLDYRNCAEDHRDPEDYLTTLGMYAMGLRHAGDTPKSFRMAELAMLGTAIVTVPCEMPFWPDLDHRNCVLLNDWGDADTLRRGLNRVNGIVAKATMDYKAGWSPMGQCRQILQHLRDKGIADS